MSEVFTPYKDTYEYGHSNPDGDKEEGEEIEEPIYNRLFINHVDEFNARHLAEYLTERTHGAAPKLLPPDDDIGEEENMDEEPAKISKIAVLSEKKYEVIGTKKYKFGKLSEDILYSVIESEIYLFYQEIMKCGAVIYDITQDPDEIPKALAVLHAIENEIKRVKNIGPKTYKNYPRQYIFILISTVMTWARTKPVDPDDPDAPFNENDYKKRKAHPNYTEQIACEREVLAKGRKYKEKLKTYVICAGLIYGFEEDDFFYLFKMAWRNEKALPIFLPGKNSIPAIHVQDLAKVVYGVLETLPKKQYIFAVEQTPSKLRNVVKNLSKYMGSGKTKEISKEEAFLYPDMTQKIYDRYTVNLNIEPTFIIDELGIEFRSDVNFAENMRKIIAEFRNSRQLVPNRILIHGPPASGKTKLANMICDYYGVHYITVKSMINETVQNLRDMIDEEIARRKTRDEKQPEEEEVEEALPEEDEELDVGEMQDKLRDIQNLMDASGGRLPYDMVIRLMKAFLNKNFCNNQGYVLDGFPKTIEETKRLFGSVEEEEAGEEETMDDLAVPLDAGDPIQMNIMPTHIISLDATDEFLCDRAMNLPEKIVKGTHYTEEAMLKRLKDYRANNTEDNTLLNYFDEQEIFPLIINVMSENMINTDMAFECVKAKLGLPIDFAKTPEEEELLILCQKEADRLRGEQHKIEQEILERKGLEEYQNKMEEKIHLLEELQMEEEKILVVQCEPLRNYLMKYVFPTLTQGLLEVARVKPDDPVDYLAEYLFKINPEGKMFDPTYTRQGEIIEQVSKHILHQRKRATPKRGST